MVNRTRTSLCALSAAVLLSSVTVLVGAGPALGGTFVRTKDARITIGDAATRISTLDVNGVAGVITDVDVTLDGFSHDWPDDVDVMLVGPDGTRVILMSDACGPVRIEDRDWRFSDEANAFLQDSSNSPLGDCGATAVTTSDYDGADAWPSGSPPWSDLHNFDDLNPNGRWQLIVIDDALGHSGVIEGGWGLRFTTGPALLRLPSADTGVGPASRYPFSKSVSGRTGVVGDVDVRIDGFWHGRPDDIDLLLVGPTGKKVMLMSDACGSNDATDFQYTFSDEHTARLRDGGTCFTSAVRPTSFQAGDTMPAPAPPGPYAAQLSAFDGTDPNGTWRVYLADDKTNESGFLTKAPRIVIKTEPG